MKAGEICLAHFPFGDTAGMKLRPVLLLTGAVGPVPEVLLAYISSVMPTQLIPSDIVIDPAQPEFSGTNLKVTSVLRLHKLATVHQRSIVRLLDTVTPATGAVVAQKLRQLLGL